MRPVTREEKLNLAGEYVRGRNQSTDKHFESLEDYIRCTREIGGCALVFDRDEEEDDRMMRTQDITLLLETLDL